MRSRIVALPRHAWLALRELGPGKALRRLIGPLRLTPMGRHLEYRRSYSRARVKARRWYRQSGRDVTIVIPTRGDPTRTIKVVRSIRRKTDRRRVRIIVCDDASPAEHSERLRRMKDAEVIFGDEHLGFANNANRGLRRAAGDVVLLSSDIPAHRDWLEALQQAAYASDEIGIAAPKLLSADGRIQSAGSHCNLESVERFGCRYRYREGSYGPATVPGPVLAATGGCVYVKRSAIERIGVLDGGYTMSLDYADWCLRSWAAGFSVVYAPFAELTQLEPIAGMNEPERELAAKDQFWGRWGDFFDRSGVRTHDDRLRVVYVTANTTVSGGHRDVFEHLNRLWENGHDARLYTLGEGPPDWFDLRVPVEAFSGYDELVEALEPLEAIKVATWWQTAMPVWRASVRCGIPVYFVQDIETSYYAHSSDSQSQVVDSYRQEFRYLTISDWNRKGLEEFGVRAQLVSPGVDLDTFRPLDEIARRDDVMLVIGRDNPLKNLPLTIEAWETLGAERPELWMFGVEPDLGERYGVRYDASPADADVNRLFNEATVFVQTSIHEGFCLPPLEAMAAGCPVVCTDAHGNRDFCRDGENCLMPEPNAKAVAGAIARVLHDRDLRDDLVAEGLRTAAEYGWERRAHELEAALEAVADAAGRPSPSRGRTAPR